jgi:hypothetical protein
MDNHLPSAAVTRIDRNAQHSEEPDNLSVWALSVGVKRNHVHSFFFLEARDFQPESVRGGTQQVIGKMSVTLGRCHCRVPQ